MTGNSAFRCADVALLRVPVHSVDAVDRTRDGDVPDDPAGQAAWLTAYLREAAADPPLREAVALSSPALARRWDEVCRDGSSVDAARLWRAARALTAYRLRMATRCTPFGLMAGVAAADIAAESGEAKVRFGGDHRRAVRSERDGSTPWWWTGSADRRCCAGSG